MCSGDVKDEASGSMKNEGMMENFFQSVEVIYTNNLMP